MGQVFEALPPEIQLHIKQLTKTAGLEDSEDGYEKMAQAWQDKSDFFGKEIQDQGMMEVDQLGVNDSKGAIALTYSGSLILVGPLVDGKRKCGYNSIGIRKDVPKTILKEESVLAADIEPNHPIVFQVGPVKSTSAIYKIAVCKEELEALEEEEKISDVTIIVTEEFVDINKALVPV